MNNIPIPADVPKKMEQEFINNYTKITKNSERLFLFACDQKIEHLHDDFDSKNKNISPESTDPEHFFKIASQGRIGAMATQLELIARYGKQYNTVNYIAKLNSKTNLIPQELKDPVSTSLWDVHDVIHIKEKSDLSLCGIGMTIYLGSKYEDMMMSFAAQMILDAHKHGLVAIIWMYPRGKAIADDSDAHLIAGVAGAANALGADFVKIKPPSAPHNQSIKSILQEIVTAAGNTKVLMSGGHQINKQQFLTSLYEKLQVPGIGGTAVGRNIFQHSLPHAISMTQAIAALVYDNASLEEALEYIR
jgi:DhnA family fructose-bisphosphate aldolase class Ia